MKCENCKQNHNGSYGSGRFCSRSCANTRTHSKETKEKISKTVSGRKYPPRGTKGYKWENRKCLYCGKDFEIRKLENKRWCTNKCWVEFIKQKKDPKRLYKDECKFQFNVYDFPEYFDLDLINRYGWYSAANRENNLNGVSRDHMISLSEGFINGYETEKISHPANCKLIRHKENQKKNTKSTISYEELLIRIDEFDKKYTQG